MSDNTGTVLGPELSRHETSGRAGPPLSPELMRVVAVGGILLVALNLRAATTSLSSIYNQIGKDIPLTTTDLGILGMLPPLSFAVFGALAPRVAQRWGLERSLMFAMVLTGGGQVARSLVDNVWLFEIFSIVCLGGMGLGNVLLPPVIKQYFPDRIGQLTSLYIALTAVSASLPSLVAVPITDAVGWRFATGMWAALGFVAAIPWVLLIRDSKPFAASGGARRYVVWRRPVAWAVMILFGIGALNAYAMIGWLPQILTSTAGVNPATAGIMLSVYNGVGLIHGLVAPIVLTRTKHPYYVIVFATLCLLVGYLGLAYYPGPVSAWVWVTSAGLGLMLIPIGLTLINLRSRTEEGTAELSGFVQGAGWLMGAIGPIIVAQLHAIANEWQAALWFLIGTAFVAAAAGVIAVRPAAIEDS